MPTAFAPILLYQSKKIYEGGGYNAARGLIRNAIEIKAELRAHKFPDFLLICYRISPTDHLYLTKYKNPHENWKYSNIFHKLFVTHKSIYLKIAKI